MSSNRYARSAVLLTALAPHLGGKELTEDHFRTILWQRWHKRSRTDLADAELRELEQHLEQLLAGYGERIGDRRRQAEARARSRARYDADPDALISGSQRHAIDELVRLLGWTAEQLQLWCKQAHHFDRPSTRRHGSQVIAGLKSKVVREQDLLARAVVMAAPGSCIQAPLARDLAVQFLQIAGTGGRSINRLPLGLVLKLSDLFSLPSVAPQVQTASPNTPAQVVHFSDSL